MVAIEIDDVEEVCIAYGGGLVRRQITDAAPFMRRFSAFGAAWKALDLVLIRDRRMISLICFQKPLL